jgi:hypothetical protein
VKTAFSSQPFHHSRVNGLTLVSRLAANVGHRRRALKCVYQGGDRQRGTRRNLSIHFADRGAVVIASDYLCFWSWAYSALAC